MKGSSFFLGLLAFGWMSLLLVNVSADASRTVGGELLPFVSWTLLLVIILVALGAALTAIVLGRTFGSPRVSI